MAEAQEPAGILKTEKESSKRKAPDGISWDEENLIYNESQKVPRMKIDEPPTPYNYDYNSEEGEHDEEVTHSEEVAPRLLTEAGGLQAALSKLENVESDPDAREKPGRQVKIGFGGKDEEDADEDEEARRKRLEFKKKRSQHYNEFQKVKEMRERGGLS